MHSYISFFNMTNKENNLKESYVFIIKPYFRFAKQNTNATIATRIKSTTIVVAVDLHRQFEYFSSVIWFIVTGYRYRCSMNLTWSFSFRTKFTRFSSRLKLKKVFLIFRYFVTWKQTRYCFFLQTAPSGIFYWLIQNIAWNPYTSKYI